MSEKAPIYLRYLTATALMLAEPQFACQPNYLELTDKNNQQHANDKTEFDAKARIIGTEVLNRLMDDCDSVIVTFPRDYDRQKKALPDNINVGCIKIIEPEEDMPATSESLLKNPKL